MSQSKLGSVGQRAVGSSQSSSSGLRSAVDVEATGLRVAHACVGLVEMPVVVGSHVDWAGGAAVVGGKLGGNERHESVYGSRAYAEPLG